MHCPRSTFVKVAFVLGVSGLTACNQQENTKSAFPSENGEAANNGGLYRFLEFEAPAYSITESYSLYTNQRQGFLSPNEYEELARRAASETYSIYNENDFNWASVSVSDYEGDDVTRQLIQVVFVRHDGMGSHSKDYLWTTIDFVLSKLGRVVASRLEYDRGLNQWVDERLSEATKTN